MIKPLLAVLFLGLFFSTVQAQKSSTVYYLTNSGKLVSTKDSADYWMEVMPPDTAVDKSLYMVYEYNKNGRVRLATGSYTQDLNLKYQGPYIAYFKNGQRKGIGRYRAGNLRGRQTTYYPNGKLYSIVDVIAPGNVIYNECRDSTGTMLTQNGTGFWKQFSDDFDNIVAEGQMKNGVQDGEWHFNDNTVHGYQVTFKDGQKVQSTQPEDGKTFVPVEVVPSFPGGIGALYKFLAKNMRYPRVARENNIEGKVVLSFVVERDGSLTDVKVHQGIGSGCDEEALRVIKLSSPWLPGMQGGRAVRVAYSVPVNFALSN